MIYITEIAHRLPTTRWTAVSRADMVRIVRETLGQKRMDASIDPQTYDECVDYLRSGLHGLYVTELDITGLSRAAVSLLESIIDDNVDADKAVVRVVLEDGAALKALGIGDDDTEALEELHAWTRN